MNKKIFKFVREAQTGMNCGDNALAHIVGKLQAADSKSDKLVPLGGNTIDVVKDFKWTKTRRNSEGRANVPTLDLEEYYVTTPAFFSNFDVAKQILATGGAAIVGALGGITDVAGVGGSVTNILKGAGSAVSKGMDDILDGIRASFKSDTITVPNYLKAYDNLYGVTRSRFNYKLPYLEDDYKSISSNWTGAGAAEQADAFTGGLGSKIIDKFQMLAPGVGIDYSKSFSYPDAGPSHNVVFHLDNTIDSEYSYHDAATDDIIPNYETNFRLVFLLLYQNLPNRLNKIAYVPPVIYRSKVPGMFSYRYSYINSLSVNMIGVRKNKHISNFIDTEDNRGIDVVIPEAYEVGLTVTSLVPESKNLYFDAINNPVTTFEDNT